MSRAIGLGLLLSCLVGLDLPAAQAETVTISARYRPDQADFIDANTPGRLCELYNWLCVAWWRGFAIDLPIEFTKVMVGGANDIRDQLYLKTPQDVRIAVTHDRTGEREEVLLSFVGFSQRVFAPQSANPIYSPTAGGCSVLGLRPSNDYVVGDWRPSGICFGSGGVPGGVRVESPIDDVQAIVRIDTPSPYRMKHGVWRGSVSFTAGNGGDIDFGNQVTMTRGSQLQIDLELEVVHAFVLDFPPGSNRAVLEPPGGWPSFWNSRRQPSRLYREHPFRLWSSGPFKMYMTCEYTLADACALQDRGGPAQVPLKIAVSLPHNLESAGASVRKLEVPVGRERALAIDSLGKGFDQRGALHYEVTGEQARLMESGHTYEGGVTFIFDAEL